MKNSKKLQNSHSTFSAKVNPASLFANIVHYPRGVQSPFVRAVGGC